MATWLQGMAQDCARASNDPDWESKLKEMLRTAKDRAVNRKLGAITKG